MALSNMNKDVITRLMQMISSLDAQLNEVKCICQIDLACFSNANAAGAGTICCGRKPNKCALAKMHMTSKQVPGTIYHLYTQNSKDVLSIISPQEWKTYDEYHGAFLFDFDYTFRRQWRTWRSRRQKRVSICKPK